MLNERESKIGNDYTVHSVQTALHILSLFMPENASLSLMEISQRLSLNKSLALRMTATLTGLGYLKIHPETRRYMLGSTVLRLGLVAYDALDLQRVSTPILQRMADATGCTICLCSNEHNTVVVIMKAHPHEANPHEANHQDANPQETNPQGRVSGLPGAQAGSILPTHCTGMGLLFLSQEEDTYIRHYLEGIDRIRDAAAPGCDTDAIMDRIERIRTEPFCVDVDECEKGIVSIVCPIRGQNGRVIAGAGIGIDRAALKAMDLADLKGRIQSAAMAISRQLGYPE